LQPRVQLTAEKRESRYGLQPLWCSPPTGGNGSAGANGGNGGDGGWLFGTGGSARLIGGGGQGADGT